MTLQNKQIKPVKILVLNLMPTKEDTERQLLSRLNTSFLPIETTFLTTASYESKNTSKEHMKKFYKTLDQVRNQHFDGMIITGAPVETMPFEEVLYWDELKEIMDWAMFHTKSVLHICWGAQAGIYYHYGIEKHPLDKKISGIYSHHIENKQHPLMRGLPEGFLAPHSRYTTVLREDVVKKAELELLAGSDETDTFIVADKLGKNIFVMGHMEYDRMTLDGEYYRDLGKEGVNPAIPHNYYPEDDPTKTPEFSWFDASAIFFQNWVYQYLMDEKQLSREYILHYKNNEICYN